MKIKKKTTEVRYTLSLSAVEYDEIAYALYLVRRGAIPDLTNTELMDKLYQDMARIRDGEIFDD